MCLKSKFHFLKRYDANVQNIEGQNDQFVSPQDLNQKTDKSVMSPKEIYFEANLIESNSDAKFPRYPWDGPKFCEDVRERAS